MRNYGNVVVIAISAIYSVISMTVATSVVVIMDIIGYKLPVTGEISYAVVMVSSLVILYFSASRLLHEYGQFSANLSVEGKSFKNNSTDTAESRNEAVLNEKEEIIMDVLRRANGRVLQNALISKTGMTAPTISRTLLSLENKGLIERKRHGMTNEIWLTKR